MFPEVYITPLPTPLITVRPQEEPPNKQIVAKLILPILLQFALARPGTFHKYLCMLVCMWYIYFFGFCFSQDIPSTGLEGWFKLEARSQRSSVQGRIRLKMWLSTRENRGVSEEDNWTELTQHENLYATFVDYELRNWGRETWTWNGDLPGPALTILHQHAVQGELEFRF